MSETTVRYSDLALGSLSAERFPTREPRRDMALFDRAFSYDDRLGCDPMTAALRQQGFTKLKEGQEQAVYTLIAGQDLICVFPTGFGKTATFEVPTLCHNWSTLVFSPLISLQKDQVDSQRNKGIPSGLINSHQTEQSNQRCLDNWRQGKILLMYVAPERLANREFLAAMSERRPDFVVVDEAHCLSDWSDSFRPDYQKIGDFVAQFPPQVIGAFTGTCGQEECDDIRRILGLGKARLLVHMPKRDNLEMVSAPYNGDGAMVSKALRQKGSTIIYCGSRKGTEEVAALMSDMLSKDKYCSYYHAECSDAHREHVQQEFMNGNIQYLAATCAFGMGINKPDIRCVIHREAPKSLSALMQEMGRAGRDGQHSLCLTYDNPQAKNLAQFFLKNEHPERPSIVALYQFLVQAADRDGKLSMTVSDMAKRVNIHSMQATSILEILRGANVLDRQHEQDKTAGVEILMEPDELPTHDQRYSSFVDAVRRMGDRDGRSSLYLVSLKDLAGAMAVTYPTVTKYSKLYHDMTRIRYTPPYAGKSTALIGDISQVDFDRLDRKRELAYQKLAAVEQYLKVPNVDKADFLQEYFKALIP